MSDWHLVVSFVSCSFCQYSRFVQILVEDRQGFLSTNAGTNCGAEHLKATELLHPYTSMAT